jgi:hypothetical protein
MRRMPPLDTRAGHQDRDIVAVAEHFLHEGFHVLTRAQVGRVDSGFASEGADLLLRLGVGGIPLYNIRDIHMSLTCFSRKV